MLVCHSAFAFEGSAPENGQKYYLFNIYQAKFLGSDSKLQSINVGSPSAFTVNNNAITINGTKYTLSAVDKYYQLKNGSQFLAFEKKVDDPDCDDEDNKENRRMYKGGGVTCSPTTINDEQSYWLLISENEYSEWLSKKKVTFASLNVDGMPASISVYGIYPVDLNGDAKEGPGATAIGNRLRSSGFDVVGVSEDFNFHSELWTAAWNGGQGMHYNAMTHRNEINGSRTGILSDYLAKNPVADTDGLGLFYRIDGSTTIAQPSQESWTQWTDHYGYTDSGADGLIKKGYRYYLITLADGTQFDLYTMHMDANDSQGDRTARASQLTQLVTAIKATNNKRPIIIIGDSNCRYTRDNVKELLIDAINNDSRFTIRDPWIKFGCDNTYPIYPSSSIMAAENGYLKGEVVDKIWYINNTDSKIRLVAETYCQDLSFVDESGSPLCDHKPCVVTFSYHDYDPLIDDVAEVETTTEAIYLRNRATGRYLMNGGWWGSHAVVGNYAKPYYIQKLNNGKYDITSAYGHITDAAYVDNSNQNEYIAEWTILNRGSYKILSYVTGGTNKALTANDNTYFNNDPLYRYATTAALNIDDPYQQWEIITKEMLAAEVAKASAYNPINVTHYIKSANFDRIDWNEHGSWTFDYKGNSDRVTDNGINGSDNDAFCNYNRSVSTKSSKVGFISNSNNQWDCYQKLSVPAGYYILTNQGLEKATKNTVLYAWANPGGKYTDYSTALSTYQSSDFSSGDTQKNAAVAFNNGKYHNVLSGIQVGDDGVLVIGVKKTENNSTSGWMVFDNFQLYYLGKENPNRTYNYDVITSGRLVGDVDHDGDVDIDDAEALSNMLTNDCTYDISADLNQDGQITIQDLSLLVNILLEKK